MIRDYDLREGCRELYNKKAKEVKQFFDFKDCLFVHTTTTTKYTNLRKWVQYWANNYGDADQVLKTLGNRDVLVEIGWEQTEWIDCIYSFKTYFAAFLRKYFDEPLPTARQIMVKFDIIFSEESIQSFAQKNNLDENLVYELLDEMDVMAKLTHTLGNYMPCFDNTYNELKGFTGYEYVQDRIELLYDELINPKYKGYIDQTMRKLLCKWLEENKQKYVLAEILDNNKLKSYTFSNKRGRALIMENENDLRNYLAFLREANRVLVNRNISMNELIAKL